MPDYTKLFIYIQGCFLMKLRSIFISLFTWFALFFCTLLPTQAQSTVFMAGEELEYSVSFLGIRLGTIKIVTEGNQTVGNMPVVKGKAHIDSHPNIPFVSLHAVFESWMAATGTHSLQFVANTQEDKESWMYDKYTFDYTGKMVKTEKYLDKQLKEKKVFNTAKKWNDGCSLFFTARHLLKSGKTLRIPTIVKEDTVFTTIAYKDAKVENVEIDALDYEIRTVHFQGEANWTGVYGITGKFDGWFSDDEARVPIRAKMKLYVGNADIELVRWKRPGWTPPKG